MIQCQFEVNSTTVGKLRIGPLAAAAAQAAGTVLRKALLRDVAGACVSAVRIEGVTHEFARVDGVRPELPRIVENLRACRVGLRGAGPAVVSLVVDGPRTVTAADLASNPAVTAADPARVIATVGAGSRLAAEVEITRGTGQECVERIQGRRPGWIEIDRDWCPVDRVGMNIDGPADGSTLVLEVATDGTTGPAEATVQAATALQADADLPEAIRSLCRSVIAAAQAPTNRPMAAPARPAPSVRTINKTPTDPPIPDLIDVQRRSFEWFVQRTCPPAERQGHGLHKLLGEAFPVTLAGGEELAYVGYDLDGPADDWRDCVRLGRTWAGALRLRLRRAGDGRAVIVEGGRLPLMTQRGTFVIDGREKVVLGRLQADSDTESNDLATRRLLMVGPQLQEALAGPLAADVRAAAKLDATQGLALPAFADAVHRFFARGRFVRQVEATNPLTLVSHLRRVAQCGVNKTPGYDARIAQANHFGRLCLLETPEGDSIGLNLNLAILAEIDEQTGQILAAYRRPSGGAFQHVPASAEANLCIGDLADEAGRGRYGGRMLAKRGDQIVRVEPGEVDLLPANAGMALGASASLIPLVAHDDANRALMGANMQKQAVPLLSPEAPIVRTGMEARVVEALGACVDPQADLPASDGGVLALGRTVLVGYLPWEGYNFEDAIVVRDRLVRGGAFTSVKSLEFVATVARTADAGAEAIGAGHLPAAEAAKLRPDGVVAEGADVEGGDVLVAKSVRADGLPAGGSPGGAPRRDASVRVPCGQRGTVVRVERCSVAKGDALGEGLAELVRVTVAVRRRLAIGDKLANRHGAKGTVARIVPADEMPVLPDGRSLDLILSPLGVPSRMNIGQLLETHLGLAAHELNCTVVTPGFGGASPADIGAMLVEAGLPASGMLRLRDGRTGRLFDHESTVGYLYAMKLCHMAEDRWQGRCTGEYSPLTQQPVSGRRQGGGQHIGIMETWALQAHGAGRTLQELLTIQSDDVAVRPKVYASLLTNSELPRPTVPHSVKRLVSQLRGLGLDLRLIRADGRPLDPFAADAAIDDAASVGIEFASPETIRRWSAGELTAWRQGASLDEALGLAGGGGLAIGHLELAAPVAHPWRTAVGAAELAMLQALPLLGADLRGSDDLDALYRAVFEANRAATQARGEAAAVAVAALQSAVDRLFGDPAAGGGLTALLRGKRGWVTAALSGKTVDYSARAVVSPGCDLRYDECGLPKDIAKSLFEPMVLGELVRSGHATSADHARAMLRADAPEAVDALRRIAGGRFVFLHRAPVLHRVGIQAFRARITDEHVIRIHPLTMRSFNADFDGDEMDVYVPRSPAAQAEAGAARSSLCQLAPADGSYMNFPAQEMVLGCYYATLAAPDAAGPAAAFASADEAADAYERGEIGVGQTIVLGGTPPRRTTVGRAMFNRLLPVELGWIDEPTTAGRLRRLLTDCWRGLGPDAAGRLGDAVMRFGFHLATLSGLSIGKDVLVQHAHYDERLADAWRKTADLETRCRQGSLGEEDFHQAILELWWQTSEEMAREVFAALAADRGGLNPVHLMVASGARGSWHHVRQHIAMRGLFTTPDGRVIGTPFTTTFIRGHSPLEYLASSFGARKGLADTSLKSAEAGFLFKRIVSAVHDTVISGSDCGVADGIVMRAFDDGERVLVPLAERIAGRTAAQDIVLPGAAGPLVKRGWTIGPADADAIASAGVDSVAVHSPLACRAKSGVCAKCYGVDLSTWQPPAIGLPVGLLAAQSIGEPMTQLTMRTFHIDTPAMRSSAGKQKVIESIIGGLRRMDLIFELGRPGGREPDEQGIRDGLLEVLRTEGPRAVAERLAGEVHGIYRQQGVRVDDRHYEVVLREMIGRLQVTDPDDTSLEAGQIVSADLLAATNAATAGRAATAEPTVVGVTEAAVSTADFIAAAASHGGLTALARAAARRQTVPLRTIRHAAAFGLGPRRT